MVQSLGLNDLEPFPSLRPSHQPRHPALCPCSPGHPVFSLPCSASFAYRCSDSSGKTPLSQGHGAFLVFPQPSAYCPHNTGHAVSSSSICVSVSPSDCMLLEPRGLILTHHGPPGSSKGLASGGYLGNLGNQRTDMLMRLSSGLT